MRITEDYLIKDILKRTDIGENIYFCKKERFKVIEVDTEEKFNKMMSLKNITKIKYRDLEINTVLYNNLNLEYIIANLRANGRKTSINFNN